MPITFDEKRKIFRLSGKGFLYSFFINGEGIPVHLHYGAPSEDDFLSYSLIDGEWSSHYLSEDGREKEYSSGFPFNVGLFEVPPFGKADHRPAALIADDCRAIDLRYVGHRIYEGKPEGDEYPRFRGDGACQSLELVLADKKAGIEVRNTYTVYGDCPLICFNREVKNLTDRTIYLRRTSSVSLDFAACFHLRSFPGMWCRERMVRDEELAEGSRVLYSEEGRSSHSQSPFAILENENGCYCLSLVHSGSFRIEINTSPFGCTRVVGGLPDGHYELSPLQTMLQPEAVCLYSDNADSLSVELGRAIRNHLLPNSLSKAPSRVLLNSWEGCYMDFDTGKLLEYVDKAKQLGVGLFVLDDGWFKGRNDDSTSLGDWDVDEDKVDLDKVIDRCHRNDMMFGLWIEPEMISPRSRLYAEHPEFSLGYGSGERSLIRHQLALNLANEQAFEYVYGKIDTLLSRHQIDYLKWDHNRSLDEFGDNPGQMHLEQAKAYYRLSRKLREAHPNVLFHGCASGGGRFDLGTLAYFDEVWGSDELDPASRAEITYGTSYLFPMRVYGCHVGKSPLFSYEDKAKIALFGTYGYEFDPRLLSDSDVDGLKRMNEIFNRYHGEVIRQGDCYRLERDADHVAMMSVSKDADKALVLLVCFTKMVKKYRHLRMKGLDRRKRYSVDGKEIHSGAYLCDYGLNLSRWIDGNTCLLFVLEEAK